ncbi:MAG: hypothetical protein KA885_11495 [Spirochaetes bacterium]|nr:hypothetical protein [Spirochaetota bacterium]
MKKLGLFFIFLITLSFSAVAEDVADSSTTNSNSIEKSFFVELKNYIGKTIVVYISDVDITVRGE